MLRVARSLAQRQRRRLITEPHTKVSDLKSMRAEARARLIGGIARARRWADELVSGGAADTRQMRSGRVAASALCGWC